MGKVHVTQMCLLHEVMMLAQTHNLLTPEAKAISPEEFEEQVALAQEVYGISSLSFSDSDGLRIDRALALQVNDQVAGGVEASILKSYTRGDRSLTFKDGLPGKNRLGSQIVTQVLGLARAFDSISSLRGNG